MVRGNKGKGKKQTDIGSDDEKSKVVPVQRRRGRPLKSLKDEVQEKEIVEENVGEREEEEEPETAKSSITSSTSNELKDPTADHGRKRKRSSIAKETPPADSNGGEKKSLGFKNGADQDSSKTVGFRQNGSRRKNKPRRAAEVGVECN